MEGPPLDPSAERERPDSGSMVGPGAGTYDIRSGEAVTRTDQVALFEACFGQAEGGPVLAWRYDRCPHGEPICLLGFSEGQPVSGYACNPRHIGWGDDSSLVGQTGDVMTHADARGKGFFSRLDQRAMELAHTQGWPVAFGLPNRQSAQIFIERLGWKGVGHLQPFTFVVQAGPGARAERMRAGRIASWLTSIAARAGRRARRHLEKALDPFGEFYRVESIERFGDWVEPIGREVAKDFAWMVRRDAAYLNWRFFESPNARFEAFRMLDSEGIPKAYGVVQWPQPGEVLGYLVDLVACEPGAKKACLAEALDRLQTHGAEVVRSHAIRGSDWHAFLRDHAFQAPKAQDEKWVIAHVHQADHPLGRAALDPTRWFFTDADRDDELVR